MHCPHHFHETRLDVLHELIIAHPLASLITAAHNGLMCNPIPFTLHPAQGQGVLRAHLARGNPQLNALRDGCETLIVFQGPQCYITPSWYPSKQEHGKAVPTWNYAMVQVRGTPIVTDDAAWLRAQLDTLTRQMEQPRSQPWQLSDAPDEYVATMLRGIVGVEIPIRSIEGKWKLSQNRTSKDRQGVMDGLRNENMCPAMLKLMT